MCSLTRVTPLLALVYQGVVGATGGNLVSRDTKRELTRLCAQYAVALGRIWSAGRDAAVPPFDASRIGATPSCGPSRMCCSSYPKQDCLVTSQRAPRTTSKPRDVVVDVLPSDFLFALAVAGMESTEKGPGVTLGELGMLRNKLSGRLEALGPGEADRGPQLGVWAVFTVKYKGGQRGLLWVVLEEP